MVRLAVAGLAGALVQMKHGIHSHCRHEIARVHRPAAEQDTSNMSAHVLQMQADFTRDTARWSRVQHKTWLHP